MAEGDSKAFKAARRNANLTQEEASYFTDIPVRTLQEYEEGRHEPTFKNVCKMARAYKCSLDVLARAIYPELYVDEKDKESLKEENGVLV